MQSSLNESKGELEQYTEDQKEWRERNDENVQALRGVLEKKGAFKINYYDHREDVGLISETDYMENRDIENLKNIDKYTIYEEPDPDDPDVTIERQDDNPVKEIFDKIAQGSNVQKLQLVQERQYAEKSSFWIRSSDCICEEFDKDGF